MSLGATTAWTICTNWAAVRIFRPTLVCFTVLSNMVLLRSAMFELFLTSVRLGVSFGLRILPHKCMGTREYVCKPRRSRLHEERRGFKNAAL